MLTLGIDTATRVCAVSLCRDEEVLAAYEINMGLTHSEGLVPQLKQLFERTGVHKRELELISVSMGPGSFTGLRIGLATAEAMAYALHVPIIGVSTLEALAYSLPVPGLLTAPVLDAQKGNYYLSVYAWQEEELKELRPVEVVAGKDVGAILAAYDKQVIVMGEAEKLVDKLSGHVTLATLRVRMPKAAAVALLGEAKYLSGERGDVFAMEPFYIRKSEAEELWEKRQQQVMSSEK